MIKFCKKCQTETDRTASGRCKPCTQAHNAAWRAANRDYIKAYMRVYNAACYVLNPDKMNARINAWRGANKDKVKSYIAVWRDKNPEKVAGYARKYNKANTEKVKLRKAAYRSANREKVNAYARLWNELNCDKVKAVNRNSRARRRRNTIGTHTAADIRNLMALQKSKCACCKTSIKDGYHVDHVIPLARGGSNDRFNLQLLCAPCNLQKNAKHPIDFMQSRGFLL